MGRSGEYERRKVCSLVAKDRKDGWHAVVHCQVEKRHRASGPFEPPDEVLVAMTQGLGSDLRPCEHGLPGYRECITLNDLANGRDRRLSRYHMGGQACGNLG